MLREFKELVDKLGYVQGKDKLVLVGDLVDRGPDSPGVVRFAREIGAVGVQGNHDNKFVRYHKHEHKKKFNRYYKNPMKFDAEKLATYNALSEEDHTWLRELPSCLPLWEYNACVVHAGCLPGKPVHEQHHKIHYYTRFLNKKTFKMASLGPDLKQPPETINWVEVYDGTIDVIYGHNVVSLDEPLVVQYDSGARTVGIDTGACFGGHLSALVLTPENPKGEFVQVKAHKAFGDYRG